MYTFFYGGKQGTPHYADIADDLLVVRSKANKGLNEAIKSPQGKKLATMLNPIVSFEDAGVTVLQCVQPRSSVRQFRDTARRELKKETELMYAGRVVREQGQSNPMVYTENLFIKFFADVTASECESLLSNYQLQVKRKLNYALNAYFIAAKNGIGLAVFQLALDLLELAEVELCHPELIRQVKRRGMAAQQWHLGATNIAGQPVNANTNAQQAWQTSKGQGVTIAIIDDGVDTAHIEFSSPGKIVAPRDVTMQANDALPKSPLDNHGTACAGVACAEGKDRASGVAPQARLMPIRLRSNLGSQAEADAFEWAADNGADVISCSWGPMDGQWWNPNDRTHHEYVALPDSTRLAIDYAVNKGRGGKGCVITWAAGNGNEDIENDGYASYHNVIAVAASNDRNSRSIYSDYGKSVWCCFPSNDFAYAAFNHPAPYTPGIWTTDRSGRAGYNPGELNPRAEPPGDDHGHYTESFGGTSSASPGIAGIAALILAVNPQLQWQQVRAIIRNACVKIDAENGSYDSLGHSPFYGYGLPDAAKAVAEAKQVLHIEEITPLQLSANTEGYLSKTGEEHFYAIYLTTTTRIDLIGSDEVDFDLYIRRRTAPSKQDFDERSYQSGSNESITLHPPSAGKYFIMVRSYQGRGAYHLQVTQLVKE